MRQSMMKQEMRLGPICVSGLVCRPYPRLFPAAMFYPKDNPGFYAMSEDAKKFIVEWTTNDWYESSTGDVKLMVEHEEL